MPKSIIALTPVGDALLFKSLNGFDAIGALFQYQVELQSTSVQIDSASLIGKALSVEIECQGGLKRYLSGDCTQFAFTGKQGRFYSYSALVQPSLYYTALRIDNKIFQHKTAPDIIKEVLGDFPLVFEDRLMSNYPELDYCVQYRETSFNFINRLMQEYGIYYYFEQSAGGHKLILCDAIGAHKPVLGVADIPYYPPDLTYSDEQKDHFTEWQYKHSIQTGKYTNNDFDFKGPQANLKQSRTATNPKASSHSNPDHSFEYYDFPGGYPLARSPYGEELARIRIEEQQVGVERVQGSGHVRHASVGHLFSLERHPRSDQNQRYLIERVDYDMQDNTYESDGSGSYHFDAHVSSIPASVPYRSERSTAKPRTTGPESAIIVGPPGEEVYTDAFGRVKIQFHWDRIGQKNENSSCWVRVSHPWAGSGFGAIHTPRIGQEVLVDFINGDPDRPIVAHRLYNQNNMPPWNLPANKMQSGFLTRSSKGGAPGAGQKNGAGDANALRFDDSKGAEQLWLHAEKDQLTEVEHDEDKWVGNDRRKTVDKNETNSIGQNRTETIGNNETISIGDNRKETVGKNENIDIGQSRTKKIGKHETDKIGKNWSIKVGKFKTETINMAYMQNVGLGKMVNIGAGYNLNVGAIMATNVGVNQMTTVGSNQTTNVGSNQTIDIGNQQSTTVGSQYQLTVGGSSNISMDNDSITLQVGKSVLVMKSDGTVTINGEELDLVGSKHIGLDSKRIDFN